MADRETLMRILELGRWAPSGDNTQPWRFEIVDIAHVVVHGFDTRDDCVYDLDGHASQLALGCLLETMVIAASQHGLRADISRRGDAPETHPTFDIRFVSDPRVSPDPLIPFIRERRVQRRAMRTSSLSAAEKNTLEASLSPDYQVIWKERLAEKWTLARLMFANAYVRLTTPEAYRVHRAIIEWDSRYSETRIPDQAVGVDPLTLKLMRWAMESWERVDFLNRYLMGTLMPRLQLDLIPGLACSAHFGIVAPRPLTSMDDYVAAGRNVQRFWLSAARLGFQIQPEMTPIIFSRYIREGRSFTGLKRSTTIAGQLALRLREQFSHIALAQLAFLGRIGPGPAAKSRSTRQPLSQLMKE